MRTGLVRLSSPAAPPLPAVSPPPCSTLFPYATLFRFLLTAFAEGKDIHRATAAEVFGLPLETKHFCRRSPVRSEEHTSELQSRFDLVCRLLREKKTEKARTGH